LRLISRMAIVRKSVFRLHLADAGRVATCGGKIYTRQSRTYLLAVPRRCLNCRFEQQGRASRSFDGRWFHRGTSLKHASLLRLPRGLSDHDDKRRHRTFHRAFRTLSLASSPRFRGFCAGPRCSRRSQRSPKRVKRAAASLIVRSGRRARKFSVESDDILK
jgi:hypothetical protein